MNPCVERCTVCSSPSVQLAIRPCFYAICAGLQRHSVLRGWRGCDEPHQPRQRGTLEGSHTSVYSLMFSLIALDVYPPASLVLSMSTLTYPYIPLHGTGCVSSGPSVWPPAQWLNGILRQHEPRARGGGRCVWMLGSNMNGGHGIVIGRLQKPILCHLLIFICA